jgi:hypothetical protein
LNCSDDEFFEESSAALPAELFHALAGSIGQTDSEVIVAEKPTQVLSQSLRVARRRE